MYGVETAMLAVTGGGIMFGIAITVTVLVDAARARYEPAERVERAK
jgi:hypothetical protein